MKANQCWLLEQLNSIVWISSLTSEFDLQHLVDVLNNVAVGAERVTRAVNADLQAEVGLWAVEQYTLWYTDLIQVFIMFRYSTANHNIKARMSHWLNDFNNWL